MAIKGFWFVLAGLCASTVLGQAQRTFVSTSGSDANTASLCSVANPCRGFAAALSVTNSGGEVVVLSSGGYGTFTVDESVAIVSPPGVYTGISVFSGNGITVNAPGATVVLRGLTINNQGSVGSGIEVAEVEALYVESCVVNGFNNSSGSVGIRHLSSGKLFVKDSIVRNNYFGILVQAPSATSARVSVDRTRVENSVVYGIYLERARGSISASVASGNLNGIVASVDAFVAVTDCVASSNGERGVWAISGGRITARGTTASENTFQGFLASSGGQLNLEGCTASGNGTVGVASIDTGTVARVSSSVVTNNTIGGFVQTSSGVLESRGNNTVRGNGTNVSGTITPISGN